MENRRPNKERISSMEPLNPDVIRTSVSRAPSTVPPPPVSIAAPAGSSHVPYTAFISHAGEDKVTIAIPLRERLHQRGITAFVDMEDMPPATEAVQAMVHAMETATIGVVILSPEFVARKWPMKELMRFLKRLDECVAAGVEGPKIIPFFYRLGISELYDEPRLDRTDSEGNKLYEISRFYERQRNGEPEANIAGIKAALKKLHGIMGVENFVNANNDNSYKMSQRRGMMLQRLCDRICEVVPESEMEHFGNEQTREGERDLFRSHFDIIYDVSELVYDFSRKDSDGKLRSQEGKILEMTLDKSMDRNRAIAVRGIGGVGKTCLLRKIQSLEPVFERFQDGVYYMELGKDATRGGLKEVLISQVLKSGGKQNAKNMQAETNIGKVMEAFRLWFAHKECLFLIDDVWETKEVSRSTIRDMWNLHTSGRDSKVLLTTRSINIAADGKAHVSLEPREPLEDESRAILYHYAGLKPQQGETEDEPAVDEILERCAGLPLLLAVAGKGVKTLSFRRSHNGCTAYRVYADQLKTSMRDIVTTRLGSHAGLSGALKTSMDLVEERRGSFEFDVGYSMAEMHRRLSVMTKQMRVPMRMLMYLWEVEEESHAATIAKEFEQVGLADVEYEKEEWGFAEVLRLHDSVYEFALYETKRFKEEGAGHRRVLEGYAKALSTGGRGREWWSEDLENDKYVHRNVCRHLAGAGLDEELFELLLSPEWLERQVELSGVLFSERDFSVGIESRRRWNKSTNNEEEDEMEEALEMIEEAVTLSSSYVLRNKRELWFQVHGRLKRAEDWNKIIRAYVGRIESNASKPGMLCMKGLLVGVGGANTRIIPVARTGVNCMVLLQDGERVACGCENGDIAIVNVSRSEIVMRWKAHDEPISSIAIGKDNLRIVSGSKDATAKVWNVQNAGLIATFNGHRNNVMRVAITRDGKRVVSSSYKSTVQVWDIESGQRVGPSIKTGSMACLAVFKDGERVVMGGKGGKLEIWRTSSNNWKKLWCFTKSRKLVTSIVSFAGHARREKCASMTSDERSLVTGSLDWKVRQWDVETRQQVGNPFEGHTGGITCVATRDDGCSVVSGSSDKTIQVWNMENGKQACDPLIGHTGEITEVSFLGARDTIVSCSYDGTVRAWDLKRRRKETARNKHSKIVHSVSFTPNGRFLVSGSQDRRLRIWDTTSGEAVGEPLMEKDSFLDEIRGVAVTPDGRFVLSVAYDTRVRVWDLQTRELVGIFKGHASVATCVAVIPDGDHAVTGSWDKTVRVWDLKSMDGTHLVFKGHRAFVERVFVTDDGLRIISVDIDSNILVWDVATQRLMKRTRREDRPPSRYDTWKLSRRQVLDLAGESTTHDDSDVWIPLYGSEIVHGEGSEARVLGTLDALIFAWDISPDKRTIGVGLRDGQVGFLKLRL